MTLELVGQKKGTACPFAWGVVMVQGPLGSAQPAAIQGNCTEVACRAWVGERCTAIAKPVISFGEEQ